MNNYNLWYIHQSLTILVKRRNKMLKNDEPELQFTMHSYNLYNQLFLRWTPLGPADKGVFCLIYSQ